MRLLPTSREISRVLRYGAEVLDAREQREARRAARKQKAIKVENELREVLGIECIHDRSQLHNGRVYGTCGWINIRGQEKPGMCPLGGLGDTDLGHLCTRRKAWSK